MSVCRRCRARIFGYSSRNNTPTTVRILLTGAMRYCKPSSRCVNLGQSFAITLKKHGNDEKAKGPGWKNAFVAIILRKRTKPTVFDWRTNKKTHSDEWDLGGHGKKNVTRKIWNQRPLCKKTIETTIDLILGPPPKTPPVEIWRNSQSPYQKVPRKY